MKDCKSLHEGRGMMAISKETDQSDLGGDGQRDERSFLL